MALKSAEVGKVYYCDCFAFLAFETLMPDCIGKHLSDDTLAMRA